MKLSYAAVSALLCGYGAAQFIWPSPYDELEDVMFLNTGFLSRGFSSFITPCSFSANGPGRQTAAEWLRVGFHDMSTTNVYNGVHGGIDASLAYELNDGENIGAGFNSTFITYSGFFNSRLPLADLVALGVYASVRGCGGPIIPMRGGRVDATVAGPMGVPQPQNGAGTFTNQFARMGFNVTDMIQMTACGHTLGGVHAGDFPNIVAPGTVANDFQLFDNTEAWDNAIATRYVNGPDTDPLAVGISVSSGRNSDFAVFNSDNNVTIKSMAASTTAFSNQCVSILQRMIEVVDPAIANLSSIIKPYDVKPSGLQLTLLSGGTQLGFSGYIRVRAASSGTSVQLVYKSRTGAAGGTINASTTAAGVANGFDDTFTFYSFSTNLPVASSIGSFTVVVTSPGLTQTYTNGGSGFPVSDSVIVQTTESCVSNGKLTVVAAVRSTVTTPVNMTITQKVRINSGSPIPTPVPSLVSSSFQMVKGAALGPYNFYSVSGPIAYAAGAKYGVSSGSFSDTFKDPAALGTACAASAPSSLSSGTLMSSTTKTSTSSASATPTLAHKPTVGAYSFQGCYTEGDGVRALSGASFINYTSMTLEICASDCAGYNYWGVEYGGECYCGNSKAPSSNLTTLSDCSFTCPGNAYEYCGAGNRLEMYLLTNPVSTTSSVVSSTKTSSSTPTPTPKTKSTVGNYTFLGCYTEGTNQRALSGATYINYSNMTLEICAGKCAAFNYFGVEYYGECYCGDSIDGGSKRTTGTECDFACPGNGAEFCGASDRLEMYRLKSYTSTSVAPSSTGTGTGTSTSKSTTSATPTPTPSIKPKIGNYTYYGCQTEGTNVRALSSASTVNYTTMTLEICGSFCNGYKYWGVEYGGECYCGNSFGAGSVNATGSDCSFSCPGNGAEFCGAGNRLSTYYKSS